MLKSYTLFITKNVILVSWMCTLSIGIFSPQYKIYAQDNIIPLTASLPANAYPFSVNGFHIVDFKTENLVAPEGIDVPFPRFSWKLFSQDLNEKQSAYRIIVRKALDESIVWDSGKIESDCQHYIQYGGKTLEPATEYLVELVVWNKDGKYKSQIFAPFSTGLFETEEDPIPWKGKWIGVHLDENVPTSADISKSNWIAFENRMNLPVGTSVYRKTFDLPNVEAVEVAIANLAFDNRGTVYLNGVDLGGADDYKRAVTYDLLPKLREGKNVLAIRIDNVGNSPNPGGVIGAFYLMMENGNRVDYMTDESWKSIEVTNDNDYDLLKLTSFEVEDSDWNNASVICRYGEEPWGEIETVPMERVSPARYLANVYNIKTDSLVRRAVVFISGLGYNECYLNGMKLGNQICGPMYTDYNKSVPYNTYDVTDCVKQTQENRHGKVEIGVILGNGRYYAVRMGKCVHYGDPCLLFQMQVEYEDGTKDIFVSDESWKGTSKGPIMENNDYDGEVVDGRNAIVIQNNSKDITLEDGTVPRYLETRFGKTFTVVTPESVDVVDGPKGKLVSQMIPPMRETYEIKPISVKEMEPGRWIYDFGQNFVGIPRIKVKGETGTKITIRFAESLISSGPNVGELYVDNLRTAKARDIYILYGDPDGEVYEPRFTQHGGRYAELIGYPGTPNLNSVTCYTVTTDLPQTGFFETSDQTISRIFKNIEWGIRGNYLSIPTDCPQRDERLGWQGDRAAESKGEMYIFDNSSLYNKWLQDIEDSQQNNGNVSDVAPAYWQLYTPNVTWPSAQFLIPQSLFTMFGDDSAIVKHYESRKKWLDFILSFCNEDGTISKDNYGDWCVPPEQPKLIHSMDPTRQTDQTLLATSYLINDLRISATFAKYLGKMEDHKRFFEIADKTQIAFNDRFFNELKGQYDNGSQTSCILPLVFNLVPQSARSKVFNTLIENIENVTNKHIGTGLIGGQWINCLLSEEGRIDLAYTFVTNRDFPSWGYMIEKGATTVWELWNGDTADPAMNSGNHVMLVGDLNVWFFEYLAGIKADFLLPGFRHFIMCPNVVGDLTFVKARFDSASGLIISSWDIDRGAGKFTWSISIPANTTASISVPTSNPESISICTSRLSIIQPRDGEIRPVKYRREVNSFDFDQLKKRTINNRVEFVLGFGNYIITSELK